MEGASRVLVFARARPVGQETCCVEVDDEASTVLVRDESCIAERVLRGEAMDAAMSGPDTKKFSFDGVFPCDATQRDVFTQVGLPVLQEFMKGFNGTIFAYGQTGSGKTFSLLNQTPASEDAGLLPRLVAGLFLHVARDRASAYRVQCAAMQVYNEQVDDLMSQAEQVGAGQALTIQSGGVVPDLTWVNCTHPDEMLGAFTRARSNIVYAETKMNKCSSRSHAVFQIKISKRQRASGASAAATSAAEQGAGPQLVESVSAMLSVVDLAGSERVKRSGSEGARFTEATAINRSLLALGNVVSALAERKKHVPLRDSKLTRLLEGSIGGNCKTSLLVCVSPATENHGETLNTLDFASRAMRVEVNAKVNTSLVEVSAATLLADLTQATAADFGIQLGPDPEELAELRRASSNAEARAAAAERKAAQQQRAAASAEKEVQQELLRATEAARVAEAARTAQAAEAAAAQRATQEAELSAARAAAQAAAAEEAQASLVAQLEAARAAAKESAEAAERRAAELAAELAEVTHAARDKEEALSAVEKVNVQLARLRDNEAQLQQRLQSSTAEASGAKQERDTGLARAQAAEDRVRELEAKMREVEQRSTALQRALTEAAARAEKLEADLAQTKQASAEELARLEAAHAEAEMRLREQQTALEAELAGRTAAVGRAESQVAVQTEARKEASDRAARAQAALEEAAAAFETERSALTSAHTASSEAAATAFEARLNQLRAGFDTERLALERRLEEHQQHMVQQETGWRNSKEEAVKEAWETGNAQQRRLAAAFKAARCVAAAKEQTLRQTHEELNSRFAARESREEDLRALAEQRRRMESQQKELAARDAAVDDLHRTLRNRDETDRIFGDQGRGRQTGRAPLAPGPMWGPRTRRVTRAGSSGPRSCPPLSGTQTLTVGKTRSLDEEREQDREHIGKHTQAPVPKADSKPAAPRSQRLASRSPLPL